MLTEQKCEELIKQFISLRDMPNKTIEQEKEFKKHERHCIENFKYLVTMRMGRYKKFSNSQDLEQDGMEALLSAMRTYVPGKGNFFYWAHKYISTKISRCANTHSTIRYPLHVAKDNIPRKEFVIPEKSTDEISPEKLYETYEFVAKLPNIINNLSNDQKELINLTFGLNGTDELPVNVICKNKDVSRTTYLRNLSFALNKMKESLK